MKHQIFIHYTKHQNIHYRFDTPEDANYAYLEYFKANDENGYYDECDSGEEKLIELARGGSGRAARCIAELHQGFEYERWDIVPLYSMNDE